MNSRDNHLWLQLWRDRDIAFHQQAVNPLLIRYWPRLGLPGGSRVLVPLCGKSLDMLWLAAQGHEVIGVELSHIAAREFFDDNGLQPVQRQQGRFTLWQHGRISILCGDYFALQSADIGQIHTVYDRAALTALPEDLRVPYVAQLRRIVDDSTNVFLLTIEDAEAHHSLEQALGIDPELARLYGRAFEIDLAHVESLHETDPANPGQPPQRVEYKVYRLTGRRGCIP